MTSSTIMDAMHAGNDDSSDIVVGELDLKFIEVKETIHYKNHRLILNILLCGQVVLFTACVSVACVGGHIYIRNIRRLDGQMCVDLNERVLKELNPFDTSMGVTGVAGACLMFLYYHLGRRGSEIVPPPLPTLIELLKSFVNVHRVQLIVLAWYVVGMIGFAIFDARWASELRTRQAYLQVLMYMCVSLLALLVVDHSYRLSHSRGYLVLLGLVFISVFTLVKLRANACAVETVGVWLGYQCYEFATLLITIYNLKFTLFRLYHAHHKNHVMYFRPEFRVLYHSEPTNSI